MSLFGSKESYLGIDIGNSAIKLVELENVKSRPKLLTYGYIEQENEILTSTSPDAKKRLVQSLHTLIDTSHANSRNVVAALPSYTVFTSIIHLPEMAKKELAAAVNWEAKKFVPMPLEEMILDWKILERKDAEEPPLSGEQLAPEQNGVHTPSNGIFGESAEQSLAGMGAVPTNAREKTIRTKEKKFLKILLTAAPKDLVSRYLDIFKEAKLNLVSLETESFALERSLVGNDKSAILLIDIGAGSTTISVVVDSVPLINRSIDIGGKTITKAIANSLNIDLALAEQFKRDFGFTEKKDTEAGQIPQRIEFMAESIINEVKYVLTLYQSQGQGSVEKIVIAGGSAWLPNISQYLSHKLGVKVYIGDPWARVMYPVDMKTTLQHIGSRMAVAIGLAMREIH